MRVAFCAGGSVWLQVEVLAEEDAQQEVPPAEGRQVERARVVLRIHDAAQRKRQEVSETYGTRWDEGKGVRTASVCQTRGNGSAMTCSTLTPRRRNGTWSSPT